MKRETENHRCHLCDLKLPKYPVSDVTEGGQARLFCCQGCLHVYQLLAESGVIRADFQESEVYKTALRLGIIGKPDNEESASLKNNQSLNEKPKDAEEIVFHIDGMWCSACSWLIEKIVAAEKGVIQCTVSYATDTARIHYKPEQISKYQIAASIEKLSYKASTREQYLEQDQSERNALLLRMGLALFLLMNTMFFSYVIYIGYFQTLSDDMKRIVPIILLLLSTPAVFWCGEPIHRKAYYSLKAKAPTMEILLSMSIFSAYFYSVYAMIRGQDHFYFDTASALVAFLLVGKFIEYSAKRKTAEGVNRLYQMAPKKVRIKTSDSYRLASIDKLDKGDVFIVNPGEKIPADGRILKGSTSVDESLLTGESRAVTKTPNDYVIGSSMNLDGVIEVETTRTGDDTVVARITRLVEEALATKSNLERFADRVARFFIPSIIMLALSAFGYLFASGADAETALLRSITILVIACPCALGLATPLAIVAGIGYASKQGILIRQSGALQTASQTNVVVFDKTGTLTEGKLKVLSLSIDDRNHEILFSLGALERYANHPIGRAIVNACNTVNPHFDKITRVEGIEVVKGRGITGFVDSQGGADLKKIAVGSETFINQHGFFLSEKSKQAVIQDVATGATVIFFGVEGLPEAGYLLLGDKLKANAAQVVEALKQFNVQVLLLSGDFKESTAAMAAQAGIDDYTACALPEDKIKVIEKLQSEGKNVMMVGDGINDAPALAQANTGVAMGGGAEIALESSPIIILRDDLACIPQTLDISVRTVKTIKQNLIWAFLYNVIGIAIALKGLLNPIWAALAMLASSLSVIANSMRLKEGKGGALKKFLEILFPWIEWKEIEK